MGERFSFAGEHYTVTDSPALPKPVQSPLPVIVGGTGLKRTPALAARFAAEFNVAFLSVAEARLRWDAADEACETAGRADRPAYSVMLHTAIGRTDAEVARRSQPYGDGATGLIGSPEQAVDVIGQYAEAGCSRVYLQSLDLADLDQLELIGAEVIPQV